MMKLGIQNGGSMTITDSNETIVSKDVMDQVRENFERPDGADDSKQPEMTLKD